MVLLRQHTMCRHMLKLVLVLFCLSCQHTLDVTGKWQGIGTTASLEFNRDRTFNAVDGMGMAVGGRYSLENGDMRLEIKHPGSPDEIIHVKIKIEDDELTFIYGGKEQDDRYRRVK